MQDETLLKDRRALGVIVARMQVPLLTDSHTRLLNTVLYRHDRAVIFLGTKYGIDKDNPYPFLFRKSMLKDRLKEFNVDIVPLPDQSDNKLWVFMLDTMIKAQLTTGESAVLYGGRDSFIPFYTKDGGEFESVELAPADYDSGTKLRELSAIPMPKYSIEAARAILWTLNQVL